jgi:hypothetical protein
VRGIIVIVGKIRFSAHEERAPPHKNQVGGFRRLIFLRAQQQGEKKEKDPQGMVFSHQALLTTVALKIIARFGSKSRAPAAGAFPRIYLNFIRFPFTLVVKVKNPRFKRVRKERGCRYCS